MTIENLPESIKLLRDDAMDEQADESKDNSSSKMTVSRGDDSEGEKGIFRIQRMIMQNFKSNEKIVVDTSSIGSNYTNYYTQRDTLKRIRMSIKAKSAPLNLKLSMCLMAICLLSCIVINMVTKSVTDSMVVES